MTPSSLEASPPSYCMNCHELVSAGDGSAAEAPCPSCGETLQVSIGRFAGIVSVVRFIGDLSDSRRKALLGTLQPERGGVPKSDDDVEARWLTQWLTDHDVATSLFWRRCLVLAIQLTPLREGGLSEPRLLGAAREVARQAGGSQSFTPRRY